MPRGKPPVWNDPDKSWKMTTPESLELVRLRECRKMTMGVIELMKKQGWLLEDSPAEEQMDYAFTKLWNEYTSILEAQRGDDERQGLFGGLRRASNAANTTIYS